MKTRTKALLLALSAILLVVSTVFATMAYLTSTSDVVENTFTVGKVNIKLDEAKVNEYGVKVEPEERVRINTYKLIPGHTYVKDPTVHVKADSEDCYVRMIVTLTLPAEAARFVGSDIDKVFGGYNEAVWKCSQQTVNQDNNNITITYIYRYTKVVDVYSQEYNKNGDYIDLPALFTSLTVPGNWEVSYLEGMKIDIVAHAIQADGFANYTDAWTAFDAQQTTNP